MEASRWFSNKSMNFYFLILFLNNKSKSQHLNIHPKHHTRTQMNRVTKIKEGNDFYQLLFKMSLTWYSSFYFRLVPPMVVHWGTQLEIIVGALEVSAENENVAEKDWRIRRKNKTWNMKHETWNLNPFYLYPYIWGGSGAGPVGPVTCPEPNGSEKLDQLPAS